MAGCSTDPASFPPPAVVLDVCVWPLHAAPVVHEASVRVLARTDHIPLDFPRCLSFCMAAKNTRVMSERAIKDACLLELLWTLEVPRCWYDSALEQKDPGILSGITEGGNEMQTQQRQVVFRSPLRCGPDPAARGCLPRCVDRHNGRVLGSHFSQNANSSRRAWWVHLPAALR